MASTAISVSATVLKRAQKAARKLAAARVALVISVRMRLGNQSNSIMAYQ